MPDGGEPIKVLTPIVPDLDCSLGSVRKEEVSSVIKARTQEDGVSEV